MPQYLVNGIDLEAACQGDPDGVPVVLIRGLGSQMIQWPEELLKAFVDAGYFVVTFDNRDAGLSEKMPDGSRYTLSDMATDTSGLMDAIGIDAAHVLGMSMGGMILQMMALEHPDRLLSATIVMSSSRAPDLPKATPEVQAALQSRAPSGARDDVIAHELATGRLWQSPGWPFDPAERAEMIGRCWDRCYCPDGTARQFRAIEASTPDLARIEEITTPMLVIHGGQDALLLPEHGRDIARRVPNARLVVIDGMGHDLEGPLAGMVAEHALGFITAVGTPAKSPKD